MLCYLIPSDSRQFPSVSCDDFADKITSQMKLWQTADNCQQGGEKCLYEVRTFILMSLTFNIAARHLTVDHVNTFLCHSFVTDFHFMNINVIKSKHNYHRCHHSKLKCYNDVKLRTLIYCFIIITDDT